MLLTGTQRDRFARDGYLVARQLLDDGVLQPVRAITARYVETLAQEFHAAGLISDRHEQAQFEQRWALLADQYLQAPDHEPLPHLWGGRHLIDRTIYELYTDPRLTGLAASLLGPELTANGDFWVRPMIPDDTNTMLTWHQDSFYYGGTTASQLQILSVWIPLVDVHERNGCLKLIPGSHQFGPIQSRKNEDGRLEPAEDIHQFGTPTDEPMQAGDVLAFHNLTLHSSGIHSVPRQVRWSIDLRYMRADEGFDWHIFGDGFDRRYPTFTAHSADPQKVMSWEQWRAKW